MNILPDISDVDKMAMKVCATGNRDAIEQFARQLTKQLGMTVTGDSLLAVYKNDMRDFRPVIRLTADEHDGVRQVCEQIHRVTGIYTRGNKLVRVIPNQNGTITVVPLTPATIRGVITEAVQLCKQNGDGGKRMINPPPWLVSQVLEAGVWPGVSPLHGLANAPILRPDGSVALGPGYDTTTGWLILSDIKPDVPEHPTRADAVAAVEILSEAVADFPFEQPHHKSAWFAVVCTLVGRSAFSGCTPLIFVDSNIRGSGKTLLIQAGSIIATGTVAPAAGWTEDSAELEKRITSYLITGKNLVLFDNVGSELGNEALDRCLTSEMWSGRILGSNNTFEAEMQCTFVATGNNLIICADTIRRCLPIRLEILLERPEERSGFKHPNLLAWCKDNRPRLLGAALTILGAYLRAGKPDQQLSPWGSFENWSLFIRSALVWAGMADPCAGRIEMIQRSDGTGDAIAQLLSAWAQYDTGHGLVASELLGDLYSFSAANDPTKQAMRHAIENFLNTPPGKTPAARQLGNKLKSIHRRVIGGRYIEIAERSNSGQRWHLRKVETPVSASSVSGDSIQATNALSENTTKTCSSYTSYTNCDKQPIDKDLSRVSARVSDFQMHQIHENTDFGAFCSDEVDADSQFVTT